MPQRLDDDNSWRAERHQLLSHPTRLAIIRALREGPREISELARVAEVHPNTVRSHLHRLHEAGLLEAQSVRRGTRGRPTKQYRLLEPLESDPALAGDTNRLLMKAIVSLARRTEGQPAAVVATEEGVRVGRELGEALVPVDRGEHGWLVELHDRLSFAPQACERQGRMEVDLLHCPFWDGSVEEDGDVVCSFHIGMLQGAADSVGQDPQAVNLEPFVQPGCCRVTVGPAS